MKRTILFVLVVLATVMAQAQELTVTYRAVYNTQSPDLFADAGLDEEMRSSLASAYKNVFMDYQLTYKDGESDFRILPLKEKQEITFMGRTVDISESVKQQARNYTYKNHAAGIILDQVSVFGKDFLVSDSIRSAHFTIHPEATKTILGFECVKAVSADGKTTVWITHHIPLRDEPIACGLEGLILAFDNGQQTYTATAIEDKAARAIVRPQGDKPMTRKAFEEMVKKRVEMMKRNR
ncbi:GLPGLI family protein [Hoylesella enoeca]|nr:GLPGLI family protein [Hoylesella enoeca]